MLFTKQTILLLGGLLGTSTAIRIAHIEIPDTPESLLLTEHRLVDTVFNGTANGTAILAFYEDADPVDLDVSKHGASKHFDKGKLWKRDCGTKDVSCHGTHLSYTAICQELLSDLKGSKKQGSPRSICKYIGSGSEQTCCISWANPVSGDLNESDLASSGYKVIDSCSKFGTVSGLTRNTLIGDTCTTQCLSNRATGCEN